MTYPLSTTRTDPEQRTQTIHSAATTVRTKPSSYPAVRCRCTHPGSATHTTSSSRLLGRCTPSTTVETQGGVRRQLGKAPEGHVRINSVSLEARWPTVSIW